MQTIKSLQSGITTAGRAQLSLVEHALCPLDLRVSLRRGHVFETSYSYTDKHRNRKKAHVRVGCVNGLSPIDERFLWGILGLALAQPDPSPEFYATPYWVLRQLGKITSTKKGSEAFRLFRESIQRLAGVRYHNSAFYDPIRSEHREVSFGLLNYSLPLDNDSSRAWRFAWDPIFWDLISANRSSLQFDMEIYGHLSPAARRMYLLLKKVFWRTEVTGKMNLRETAVNVLGFSRSLETKNLRSKMERVVKELISVDLVQHGKSESNVKDLFTKIGVGEYQFRLNRGPAFDRANSITAKRPQDSPLFDPLTSMGFEPDAISRWLARFSHKLLSQWADITLAAMERGLVDKSPQAYFTYYVKRNATPHDWWLELKKVEQQKEAEQNRRKRDLDMKDAEQRGFDEYVKNEAKDAFEKVMNSLVTDLVNSGKPVHEAKQFARNHAELHFRNKYRNEKSPSYDKI